MKNSLLILACIFLMKNGFGQLPAAPDKLYGPLFKDVQLSGIFSDGKTFVDCTPRKDPKEIVADYLEIKNNPAIKFSLQSFIDDHFEMPPSPPAFNYVMQEKVVSSHIRNLWSVLRREPDEKVTGSSLLALPYPYVVPGGRFREIYYWDAYFTMLGLKESGEIELIENMVSNFAYLIKTFGFIPNGNRTYYLSRSQPPFFSLMIELLASIKGEAVYKSYLPALKKEYDYWMDKTMATKHVVRMPDGSILNRYYDREAIPRQESYALDVAVAENLKAAAAAVLYRNLRTAAESGWDFSSRWFADEKNIGTIQTTGLVPVDLNCLLYHLETMIAKAEAAAGSKTISSKFKTLAAKRKAAINRYCWNKTRQFYCDYNIAAKKMQSNITAAGLFPLFINIAGMEQAEATASTAMKYLVKDGGLLTTTQYTGQQWDAPNGWAPMQWVAVVGARNYGVPELAETVGQRWLALVEKVYASTGKLMEKYNVENPEKEAGGGEYPTQDGFGWTNGVYLSLKAMFTR